MPYAQQFDPRLQYLIPKECLEQYSIEYEEDNFHIKSWTRLQENSSNQSEKRLESEPSSWTQNNEEEYQEEGELEEEGEEGTYSQELNLKSSSQLGDYFSGSI